MDYFLGAVKTNLADLQKALTAGIRSCINKVKQERRALGFFLPCGFIRLSFPVVH